MSCSSPDSSSSGAALSPADRMRAMFPGVSLEPEDIFLLEQFQISYLPGWVPEAELAALLRDNPGIEAFLRRKHPPVCGFIDRVLRENPSCRPPDRGGASQEVLWTLADMLVYVKCPEVCDALEFHGWDFSLVTSVVPLYGKIVIDAGAGTGRGQEKVPEEDAS